VLVEALVNLALSFDNPLAYVLSISALLKYIVFSINGIQTLNI